VTERRDHPGRIVERAVEILRELPPVDSGVVSRIVAAAARTRAQDSAPNDDDLLPPAPLPRLRRWLYSTVAAAAIVVAVGGALALQSWRHRETAAPDQRVVPVSASREALEAAPVPTQFVYDGRARRVVLVGDFNNWDEKANPLEREPGSSLWSVTVPIQRGRHIYAFLVDSVWTVDKQAPVASDPDFGVTGSVILVGRP
jgi:hypothetical protein